MSKEILVKLFWELFWSFVVIFGVAAGLYSVFQNILLMHHVSFVNALSATLTIYMLKLLLRDAE